MSNTIKRKKILIVRPTMGQGGADRVTLVLLQNLDRQRYDVNLLLMRKEGAFLESVPADVKIFDAACRNLWFFLPSILKVIKKVQPTVVFSTCGGANMPLAIASFFNPLKEWKVILSERNILFPPGKSKLKRSIMMVAKFFFYRFADVLTSVSEGVKEDMRHKLLISPDRILVIDNPVVDGKLLEQSKEPVGHPWFDEPSRLPVILHAGRFVHQKDHDTLIKAFQIVRGQLPCRLFLLGEGPLKEKTQQLVKELNLGSDVIFAGFDTNPFKFMARCDVFVLSSLHEGMPGVLIQAMACGAPSVSTNCPSGPDEIIDKQGENGLLVPVADPAALAAAVLSVLTNKSRSDTFRKEGPEAVRRFTVDEAMKTYIMAIES